MMVPEPSQPFLLVLRDIYDVSQSCDTRTYIWGGLVQDVLSGKFLCEHGDIDGFTLNLWELKETLAGLYKSKGYAVTFLEDVQFLVIERDGIRAVFNQLELDGETAMWRHAGRDGTLYFPKHWLADTPQEFLGAHVFTSGVEFEYAIKTHPGLLSPLWKGREKDIATIDWLCRMLEERHLNREEILRQVWSYNPYWVKKGYPEYRLPSVAWTLDPRE